MKCLLIQNHEVETFGTYRSVLAQKNVEVRLVRAFDGDPFPSVHDWDFVVIGGTPVAADLFDQHPHFRYEWEYIRNLVKLNVPCLGICCGGQVLARILGGSTSRLPRAEIGTVELRLTDAGLTDSLFRGFPESFSVFEWHADVFTAPPCADVLVRGGAWHTQAYRLGNFVGLLFHFEYDANDVGRWVATYHSELESSGLDPVGLLDQCRLGEGQMANLAELLVSNFISAVGSKSV